MNNRTVTYAELRPGGVTLEMSCGHKVWRAGLVEIPQTAECLTGPCYKPGRPGNG